MHSSAVHAAAEPDQKRDVVNSGHVSAKQHSHAQSGVPHGGGGAGAGHGTNAPTYSGSLLAARSGCASISLGSRHS